MTTPPTPPADQSNLVFVPWVRSGAAAAIDAPDTLGAQLGVANITANLTVNGATTVPPLTVRLRGPADIIGIDANQIIRIDPAPGSTDFEASNFACVEFDRADYPWLFTPAAANSAGKLRPWLCLVVVRKQDGVTIGSAPNAPLPLLTIAAPAQPSLELPNLTDSWAWAHSQAAPNSAAGPIVPGDVHDALDNDPARSLSRLVCPRVLTANTDYIACVVPTFSLSAKTGQGTAVVDAELGKTSLTPSWTLSATLATVTVPVYYHWEFRTGPEGDFPTLAAKLRARPAPDRLGRRTIDISNPGFAPNAGFPTTATIDMEGALRAIVPEGAPDLMPPWPVGAQTPFQAALSQLLNIPAVIAAANPTADPVLGPTLYGRWVVSAPAISPLGTRWYDLINLDPRLRVVAALGTAVVQQNQEALVASAWEQAGEVRAANQRLRQLQMSMAVGTKLTAKHFSRLTQEHATRVGAPLFGQIAAAPTSGVQSFATVAGQLPSANIPTKAVSPAMRRIGRLRGPITRRISNQGGSRANTTPWVDALSTGVAALPSVPPSDVVTITGLNARAGSAIQAFTSITSAAVAARTSLPFFLTHPDGQPMVTALSESVAPLPFDSFQAQVFRKAATDHLARVKPERGAVVTIPRVPPPATMTDVQGALTAGTQPAKTVTAIAHTVITRNNEGNVIQPFAATGGSDDGSGLDQVMLAPAFPQAMSESLRDLSQDLILPGLDTVPADTVLGLETNRRFVESYMLGLNVEMGRELLWRGYPTDQRGTYFANFWSDTRPDIQPVSAWGTNALGTPPLAPNADERFVMLLRSSLLKRYPDALIYLTRALPTSTGRTPSELVADERQPIFAGTMDPDIAFFGFDVSTDDAIGDGTSANLGYYVVIQEHPTASRFGLQNGATIPAGTTHVAIGKAPPTGQTTLGLTWGLNSATTAGILRHRPTRLAIHASLFLASPVSTAPPGPVVVAATPPASQPPDPGPVASPPPPPPDPEPGPIQSPPPPPPGPDAMISPPAAGLPGSVTSPIQAPSIAGTSKS